MTPPNTPKVSSAQFPEDTIGDYVGTSGTFTVSPNGSNDVVRYEYSFNSDGLGSTKNVSAGSSASISYTPKAGGSHVLYVQSVDKAGRTSPVRMYRFGADFASVTGYWHLDEGSTDSSGGGNPLTVSAGTEQIDGVFKEFGVNDADRALSFDDTSDTAKTAGAVVNTAESFSVTAFVRPDESTSDTQAAVTEDGRLRGGFKLGRLASYRCPDAMATCFGMWLAHGDDTTSGNSFVVSAEDVVPGAWTHLTGVYDADTKQMSLYVCPIGTPETPAEGAGQPIAAPTVSYGGSTWTAGGSVQLGRALVKGTYGEHWGGDVDDVRVYDTALSIERAREICQGDVS